MLKTLISKRKQVLFIVVFITSIITLNNVAGINLLRNKRVLNLNDTSLLCFDLRCGCKTEVSVSSGKNINFRNFKRDNDNGWDCNHKSSHLELNINDFELMDSSGKRYTKVIFKVTCYKNFRQNTPVWDSCRIYNKVTKYIWLEEFDKLHPTYTNEIRIIR